MGTDVRGGGGASGGRGQFLAVPSTAALCHRMNYAALPASIPNLGYAGASCDMAFSGGAGLQWVPGPYGHTMSSALKGDGVDFPFCYPVVPAACRQFVIAAAFRADIVATGIAQIYTSNTFGIYVESGHLVAYFVDETNVSNTFSISNQNLSVGVDYVVAFAWDADAPARSSYQLYLDGRLIKKDDFNRFALKAGSTGLSMVYETHSGGLSVHWGEFHPNTITPNGQSVADYCGAQYSAMRGY